MKAPPIIPVTAFIDWNSQIHRANSQSRDPKKVAERTLSYVGGILARVLCRIEPEYRFSVSLRIYHGWRKGFERSENLRALITASAALDFPALSQRPNVGIRAEIAYGDQLLSALDKRMLPAIGIHLPNTLRKNTRTGDHQEKMVDTALVADVVDSAYREADSWLCVIGDDDDLVPAVLTAEAIRSRAAGRVILLRTRAQGPFLRLDGLLETP